MRDRNFSKHKARERSPSTGEPTGPDASGDRSPPRNKRVKKHHCTDSSERWEECAGCESTVPTDIHESQGVTASIMDSLNRGNHSLTNDSNAQLGEHEVSKNKTIQGASSRRKKQKNAIGKARKAAAEREATRAATTKAEMEQLLDPHMAKGHMDEIRENLVQKGSKEKERKARKQENKKRRKAAQNQQQQEHTAMVGATEGCIIQGQAEEGQSSTVLYKDSKELKREKRAARKARNRERASHGIENPKAVQNSTEAARMQSGVLAELDIGESSLYPDPIVKDASAQVPDIAQPPRCVSPASVDDNSFCTGSEMTKGPTLHGLEEIVLTEPFDTIYGPTGVVQEGAQAQGTLYKFPGPGEKHWCKLTLEQRMTKIDLNPVGSDSGKKRFTWAKVENGPVYASVVDLPYSSEIIDMLIHWLRSRVVSRVPATDLGNTLLAHTWKLLEFILRGDEDKFDDIKTTFDYTRKLKPRIQKWETVQLKTEKMFAEIESLWGKSWNDQCVKETGMAGVRDVKWKRGIVKQVKKLASTAMERDMGRGEAWGLVLKEVLAKGEQATVKAEDVWVVTETLIERNQPIVVNCGCPVSLREFLPNLPTPRSCSAIMPRRDAIALLKQIHARLPQPKQEFASLCHSHLRRLASGTFGLLNNTTPHPVLAERLGWVFDDLDEDGKNPHYEINPQWFRKPFRPKADTCSSDTPTSSTGLYKYPVHNPNSVIRAFSNTPTMTGLSTFTFDREAIFTRYSTAGKFQEFLQHGTVRIHNLFSHLDPSIIGSEFDMYEHHYQPPPGTKPMGWLRIMYHSLTQQAIRQDPAVYALHAAAREDGCWRFISYPYYTKSTSPNGEKTGFFHFDMNVSEFLATGKSRHVVQSAVTLVNDETPQGCTMLVPGFHTHIKEWWERHLDAPRGGETTNLIPGKTYTKKDEWDFGPFIPYPCKAGELRLTRPDIPHGSTPVSNTQRRVVFPWLIGIRDDHETLDVDTTETWSELAECHRNLVACRKSTSGRSASAYGRPEGKWMGAVVLGSTSSVGDALVGRRRWDDPEVVKERDLLLGDSRVEAMRWVEEVRRRVKVEFERCWELVKELERKEFGKNAFFGEHERGK